MLRNILPTTPTETGQVRQPPLELSAIGMMRKTSLFIPEATKEGAATTPTIKTETSSPKQIFTKQKSTRILEPTG